MSLILIFVIIILAVAVGALAVFAYFAWREAGKRGTTVKEELAGICEVAMETTSLKEERKQKIIDLIEEKGELSNSEIRKELGVSSRTVVRYLDELEEQGKIEQVGKTGNAVTYRLK